MRNYIELCRTTPSEEKCAQVGDLNYMINARIEANTYIEQLTRTFGQNPEGTYFRVTDNPHDFGVYLDIRFTFDDDNEQHLEYMQEIETGDEKWDNESIKQLLQANYSLPEEKDPKIRQLNPQSISEKKATWYASNSK